MIIRKIQKTIESKLFKGKIIIITGARQVGKTTLLKMIAENYNKDKIYLNCDEPDIRSILTEATSTKLKEVVGKNKLVLIDEAQRVKNIGITLKLFADQLSDYQVIATGSSALELSNEINEPLTGRKYEFNLYPFSLQELLQKSNWLEVNRLLEERVIYGMYPEVVLNAEDKIPLLKNITSSYLFKDVLSYQDIRKPEILEKLLVALSAQIGNQVSYNELSNTLRIDKDTIAKYINLLEKAFVIFKLPPFSRNIRTELSKMRKIYFYDTGIRNALLYNFNRLEFRTDVGPLWENFLITERLKLNIGENKFSKSYFWRTRQHQEIDYIEETENQLNAFEFKWNINKRIKFPKTFLTAYPGSKSQVIDRENYYSFLDIKK